jgi:hypothetical protein
MIQARDTPGDRQVLPSLNDGHTRARTRTAAISPTVFQHLLKIGVRRD